MDYTRKFMLIISMGLCLTSVVMAAMDEVDRKHSVRENASIAFYPKTYRCDKAWWKPWLWWGATGTEEFVIVEATGSASSWAHTMEPYAYNKVFGLYSPEEIANPHYGHDDDGNNKMPKKVEANTLRYVRILQKEDWQGRLRNNLITGLAGLAAVTTSIIGMNYSNNSDLSALKNSGLIALGLSGAVALWYALQRYSWVKAISSKETLRMLYKNNRFRRVFPENMPTIANAKDNSKLEDDLAEKFVIVTHGEVNKALCKYMHSKGSHYCPICLCSSDEEHSEKLLADGAYFFGKEAFDDNPHNDRFLVINRGDKPLELHKPYKNPERIPKLHVTHEPKKSKD
jgi:hypothetical protein